MRTLAIIIVIASCLTFTGCASFTGVSAAPENTKVASNYGLFLEPIEPGTHFTAHPEINKLENRQIHKVNFTLASY